MSANLLDQWKDWLQQKAQAEKAFQQIDLAPAQEAINRARCGVRNAANQAPVFKDIYVNPEMPTDEQVDALKERLDRLVRFHQKDVRQRENVKAWQAALERIQQAEDALSDAEEELDALSVDQSAAEAKLAALDKQQPKITKKALEAVEAELERLKGERQQVQESVSSLTAIAEEEESRLQASIDRLEAEKALGKGDDTALKKAKQAAESAKQSTNDRASALRGMQSIEDDLADQIDSLETVLSGVAVKWHLSELESAEGALVKALQGIEWDTLLNNINAARNGLNAHSGRSVTYDRARLKIDMPRLYQVNSDLKSEFPLA